MTPMAKQNGSSKTTRQCVLAILAMSVALVSASNAQAASILLKSTGVDASNLLLPSGSQDPHWSIVAGPEGPGDAFVVNDQSGLGLYAQSGVSQWIGVNANAAGTINEPYTFRLTFDLTGFDLGQTWLSGFWGVDDNGLIRLNGADAVGSGALSLSGVDQGNFNVFHGFAIDGGFVAGVNNLDFVVIDAENPGAFNAFNLEVSDGPMPAPVPEPSSLALSALGLAIGVHLFRRRTR